MRLVHAHGIAALALVAVLALTGCFDKPKIKDRWTRVDIVSSSLAPRQTLAPGSLPITVRANITYRAIVTGVAVAELRSSSLRPTDIEVDPYAERVPMAQDIDRLLANSVTLGRSTRAVTGWDHLIQTVDFAFDGAVPQPSDTLGLFLVCYLGSGVEVERADGSDSLVVTPFVSSEHEVLPVGMELWVAEPRPE